LSCRGTSTIGRWGTAIVVAFVLAALWLPAGASAADGAIKGEVTLASGGAPVEEAAVCAEFESPPYTFECGYTEADGLYELTGLTPGEYVVEFYAGKSGKYLMHQVYDGVSRWSEATKVAVVSGAPTEGIDAALVEGGAIAGKVTDAVSGEPVDEVLVCSWLEAGEETEACAETASDGTYEIDGVAPGRNGVEFLPFEEDYEPRLVHGISVTIGAKTANVDTTLNRAVPPEGRITGHVYAAATHAALQGISVCAIWAETGETGGCALTSPTGAYTFFPVSPGAWKIAFSPEPAEVEFFERAKSDIWPTLFWNQKPTLAEADALDVTATSKFAGIDGHLGPGPVAGPSSVSVTKAPVPTTAPKPKPALVCKKGFVKKHLRGKYHCVRKRHKHHRHHHRKHRHR
jgi:hypothetical protein